MPDNAELQRQVKALLGRDEPLEEDPEQIKVEQRGHDEERDRGKEMH